MKKIPFILLFLAPAFTGMANAISPKSCIPAPVITSALLNNAPEAAKTVKSTTVSPSSITIAKADMGKTDTKSCYNPMFTLKQMNALNIERKVSLAQNKVIYKDPTITIYARQHLYTLIGNHDISLNKH